MLNEEKDENEALKKTRKNNMKRKMASSPRMNIMETKYKVVVQMGINIRNSPSLGDRTSRKLKYGTIFVAIGEKESRTPPVRTWIQLVGRGWVPRKVGNEVYCEVFDDSHQENNKHEIEPSPNAMEKSKLKKLKGTIDDHDDKKNKKKLKATLDDHDKKKSNSKKTINKKRMKKTLEDIKKTTITTTTTTKHNNKKKKQSFSNLPLNTKMEKENNKVVMNMDTSMHLEILNPSSAEEEEEDLCNNSEHSSAFLEDDDDDVQSTDDDEGSSWDNSSIDREHEEEDCDVAIDNSAMCSEWDAKGNEALAIWKSSCSNDNGMPSIDFGHHCAKNYFAAVTVKTTPGSTKRLTIQWPETSEIQRLLYQHDQTCHVHEDEVQALNVSYEKMFLKWRCQLFADFNLLFYGLGSKKLLLQKFAYEMLDDCSILIFNGYFEGISIRGILQKIFHHVFKKPKVSYSLVEQCNFIRKAFSDKSGVQNPHLCIILHNIDGIGLRSQDAQSALSILSSASRIHLIASIDHINAPALWNEQHLQRFSWIWHDVTTYQNYSMENLHCIPTRSIVSTRSTRGVEFILQSLTPNHITVLRIVAVHQLDKSQHLDYDDLLDNCMNQLIVSSDRGLKSILEELLHHHLVIQVKKNGKEGFKLPFTDTFIQSIILKSSQN